MSRVIMTDGLPDFSPCSALFAVPLPSLRFQRMEGMDSASSVGYQTVQAIGAAQWLSTEEQAYMEGVVHTHG